MSKFYFFYTVFFQLKRAFRPLLCSSAEITEWLSHPACWSSIFFGGANITKEVPYKFYFPSFECNKERTLNLLGSGFSKFATCFFEQPLKQIKKQEISKRDNDYFFIIRCLTVLFHFLLQLKCWNLHLIASFQFRFIVHGFHIALHSRTKISSTDGT